eukprot:TRINITY_DN7287_c0_g1_i8.p1 TRINITY_DN7287_c0_g1~~TRINITY_DN7287_c0_g1_i8.p1  ORF type:complete len:176 (+),score=59.47 TRINITY_DN7287_c0_g1_i8:129-656(+)
MRVNHKPMHNINTSMLISELDKEMKNNSSLLFSGNRPMEAKMQKELNDLHRRNEELRKEIELAKAEKISLARETAKVESEISQMLKSKELDSKFLMKQEEELRKVKGQIKKNQETYKGKVMEFEKLKKEVEAASLIEERYKQILKDLIANPQANALIQQYIKSNSVPKSLKSIFE